MDPSKLGNLKSVGVSNAYRSQVKHGSPVARINMCALCLVSLLILSSFGPALLPEFCVISFSMVVASSPPPLASLLS